MKQTVILAAAGALALAGGADRAAARDQIRIVGSSTVYPFATVVAERFGKRSKFKTPVIEATGSGGGLKLFCAGIGVKTPDIANASRRIKKSEYDRCIRNGVTMTEIKIGYDGIVMANAKMARLIGLSRSDIFLALAKQVPKATGTAAGWWPIRTKPGRTSIRPCPLSRSRCSARRRPPAPAMPSTSSPWKAAATASGA